LKTISPTIRKQGRFDPNETCSSPDHRVNAIHAPAIVRAMKFPAFSYGAIEKSTAFFYGFIEKSTAFFYGAIEKSTPWASGRSRL
jgi:hypothetical protein